MWDKIEQHWESPVGDQFKGDSFQPRRSIIIITFYDLFFVVSLLATGILVPSCVPLSLSPAYLTGYITYLSLL